MFYSNQEFNSSLFKKFLECQKSAEELKQKSDAVVKICKDFGLIQEDEKEKKLIKDIDTQSQNSKINQLDFKFSDTLKYIQKFAKM